MAIDIKVVNEKMTIEIDLCSGWAVSKSGKSDVITTSGFKPVDDTPYKVSLNIIKARE